MLKKNVIARWKFADNCFIEWKFQGMESINGKLFIKDLCDILYHYYKMSIYVNGTEKMHVFTYDFPALIEFMESLRDLIDCEEFNAQDWSTQYNGPTVSVKSKHYRCAGSFEIEDLYMITRDVCVVKDSGQIEWDEYHLVVGGNSGNDCVYIKLEAEEAKCLLATLDDFMVKSIQVFNETVKKRLEDMQKKFEVQDDTLRLYVDTDKAQVDEIYVLGDFVDIEEIAGDDYEKYINAEILSINPESLKIQLQNGDTKDICIKDICYIFIHDMSNKRLNFNTSQCLEDFMSIMSPAMKNEFKNGNKKELAKKWYLTVAARTWMYRSEHGFENPKKEAKKIVKKISQKIKEEK